MSKDNLMTYQIKVEGLLDQSWSDWFEGMQITFEKGSSGTDVTILTGIVVDQAALHGVLNRLRDLNVLLLSVQLVTPELRARRGDYQVGVCRGSQQDAN